jgi:hypothetical protein
VHTYRQLDNAFGLNVVMIVDQTVTLLVRRSDGTHATNKSQFDAQCAQLSRATFGAPLFFASIDDSPIVNSVARDYNHGGGGIVDISRRWSNLTDAVASQIALRHWSLLDDTPCFISIEFAQAALHPDVRHWSLFGVDACVKKDDMRTVYLCTNRTFATVLLMMRENDMAHFRAWLEHLITGEENNNPLVRLQQQARRVAALNLFMRQPRYAEVMGRAVFKDRVGNALRARALAVHGDLFEEKVFELRNESILVGDGDHARVLRLLEDCLGDARIREIVRITPPTPLSEAAYSVTEHEFTQPKSN